MSEEAIREQWDGLLKELRECKTGGNGVSMSEAFGCAFRDPEKRNMIDKIFKAADDKMYQDKKAFKHAAEEDAL